MTLGDTMNFAAVPLGCAIRFRRGEQTVTAIKTTINTVDSAVMLHGIDAPQLFTSLAAVYFQHNPEVFAMPDLYFALSSDPDDMIIGRERNFDRGHLFIYEGQGTLLSYSVGPGSTLLNIETGASVAIGAVQGEPIEVTRWALVATLFDKPITLFTHPDDRPLRFA
jgi:hypothetical protein